MMGGPGSGRFPKGDGAWDAAAAAAGMRETLQKPTRAKGRPQPTPAPVGAEPLTPEEINGAGLMLQDGFKMVAGLRGKHWEIISDEMVPRVGHPMALILRKYGPMAERYPEVSLLLILGPGLLYAVREEYNLARTKALERRAAQRAASVPPGVATPTGVERRDIRPEGLREVESGTMVVGTPISGDRG
jgi:hypothetical protein